ncbi:MAG: hypothetical protein A4S09_14545 [Proteobacteria bacterium SG_bin7]|nr:MAG: hypothetical protein A4S09_14545 [Proteobacteria bacterium SG_bin7]
MIGKCCGSSLITKKAIVAATGLVLAGFVLMHMLGNLLLFAGPQIYNTYSYKLTSNPALYLIEAVLLFAFVLHIFYATWLTKISRSARPIGYAVSPKGAKQATLAARTMIYQGAVLLAFIIIHLETFKFGTHYEVTYDGIVMRDLYRLVIEVFASPEYVSWYVISMILLATHLYHGVSSIFQSWGFNHPIYTPILKKVGVVYALGVGVGFLTNPIFAYIVATGGNQ